MRLKQRYGERLASSMSLPLTAVTTGSSARVDPVISLQDAGLCMDHDQALILRKVVAFDLAANPTSRILN